MLLIAQSSYSTFTRMGEAQAHSVLLVSDAGAVGGIVSQLHTDGFDVRVVGTNQPDFSNLAMRSDVVVIDETHLSTSVVGLCSQVRSESATAIVVLMQDANQAERQIELMEVGANLCMSAGAPHKLLVAQIRALLELKPTKAEASTTQVKRRKFSLESHSKRLVVRDKSVTLTDTEFDIISHLANAHGKVVSREALYRKVLKLEYDGVDRAIDVHVSHIRTKLKDEEITNVELRAKRGVGYYLIA